MEANGVGFDTGVAAEHARSVRSVLRRVLAASLGMMLIAGPIALCAAVSPTSEARMACCTGNDKCPMHDGAAPNSTSHHQPSQSQADQCCVASEHDRSQQTLPMSAAVLSAPFGAFSGEQFVEIPPGESTTGIG